LTIGVLTSFSRGGELGQALLRDVGDDPVPLLSQAVDSDRCGRCQHCNCRSFPGLPRPSLGSRADGGQGRWGCGSEVLSGSARTVSGNRLWDLLYPSAAAHRAPIVSIFSPT